MANRNKIFIFLFGLFYFSSFAQLSRSVTSCAFPLGKYKATEIPQKEWEMEIQEEKIIEILNEGKGKIISHYSRDRFLPCGFRGIVEKIEGEEDEVKIGDRFVITVLDSQNESIKIRIENSKFGVILTLLKTKEI